MESTTKVPPLEDYTPTNYMNTYYNILVIWCPEPESNRHGRLSPRDFKSLVSTNFTIRAVDLLDYSLDDVFLPHV